MIWDTRLSVPRDRRDLTFNGKHQKARSGEKKEYVGVNVWYVKDNKNTAKTEQTNLHAAQPKELDVITGVIPPHPALMHWRFRENPGELCPTDDS